MSLEWVSFPVQTYANNVEPNHPWCAARTDYVGRRARGCRSFVETIALKLADEKAFVTFSLLVFQKKGFDISRESHPYKWIQV